MTYRVTVSGQSTDRKMVSKCTVLTILYSPLWSVRMDGTVVLLHEVSRDRVERERLRTRVDHCALQQCTSVFSLSLH